MGQHHSSQHSSKQHSPPSSRHASVSTTRTASTFRDEDTSAPPPYSSLHAKYSGASTPTEKTASPYFDFGEIATNEDGILYHYYPSKPRPVDQNDMTSKNECHIYDPRQELPLKPGKRAGCNGVSTEFQSASQNSKSTRLSSNLFPADSTAKDTTPAPWVKRISKCSGERRNYWHNTITGETKWTLPQTIQAIEPQLGEFIQHTKSTRLLDYRERSDTTNASFTMHTNPYHTKKLSGVQSDYQSLLWQEIHPKWKPKYYFNTLTGHIQYSKPQDYSTALKRSRQPLRKCDQGFSKYGADYQNYCASSKIKDEETTVKVQEIPKENSLLEEIESPIGGTTFYNTQNYGIMDTNPDDSNTTAKPSAGLHRTVGGDYLHSQTHHKEGSEYRALTCPVQSLSVTNLPWAEVRSHNLAASHYANIQTGANLSTKPPGLETTMKQSATPSAVPKSIPNPSTSQSYTIPFIPPKSKTDESSITAHSTPQWRWSNQECRAWLTEVFIAYCGKGDKEAAVMAMRVFPAGFGPSLYLRTSEDWVGLLGQEIGASVYSLLMSVCDEEDAIPKTIALDHCSRENRKLSVIYE